MLAYQHTAIPFGSSTPLVGTQTESHNVATQMWYERASAPVDDRVHTISQVCPAETATGSCGLIVGGTHGNCSMDAVQSVQ